MSTMKMRTFKLLVPVLMLAWLGFASTSRAQATYTENFTGTSTTNPWFFLNGACLTAGTVASSTATNPACVALPYYSNKGDPLHGGDTGTLPDTVAGGGGALRFTSAFNSENGAILSNFNFPLKTTGLAVSFTTVTYEGDHGGSGADGADGISFFLQDARSVPDVGAFGGSLGYTCSNTNNDPTLRSSGVPRGYDGLSGGYIGLGIDEFGNFLNSPDNTSTGQTNAAGNGQFQPGRIGMRGAGSTNWSTLNSLNSTMYPSSLSTANQALAVQQACQTGHLWDWSQPTPVSHPELPIPNYAAISGAFKNLPTNQPIANEANAGVTMRSQATPITYNLKITTGGLLTLTYSYNGGANQSVITGQDVTLGGANPLPDNVRFGFAGSTGGDNNIHEIMCFQATPQTTSASSAGLNQKQTAKVEQGTQVYFAFYNPVTLAGSLTAQNLVVDPTTGVLSIDSTINWDGSCVLTGPTGPCDSGPTITYQPPAARTIFTWGPSGTATSTAAAPGPGSGIPFEWTNLSTAQKNALDTGDVTSPTNSTNPLTSNRLDYLRGVRTLEQQPSTTSSGTLTGLYRDRVSVLGDIIDSSPTWVCPPSASFPAVFVDALHPSGSNPAAAPFPENTGVAYSTFASAGTVATNHAQQRTNVVYAGANDGMLHGFRTGSFDPSNVYIPTLNDGKEVMSYVPGLVLNTIQSAVTTRNYSDPQYGHKFDVDAPPGTGDLFYAGKWHTWLVGGLGPGGKAIYALDITDPDSIIAGGETAALAQSVVRGEWSTSTVTTTTGSGSGTTTTTSIVTTLNCLNDTTVPCGNNLGNTFGIPQIRRFHNGSWGAVFGNGIGSSTGDGGIYVMLVDPSTTSTGKVTFYYLSTGVVGTTAHPNGIVQTTAADLDGDHLTDYVYAGDLQGNVWRFDLTSPTASNWASTPPVKVFTTAFGTAQPITTQIAVLSEAVTGSANPHILLEFGTGQQVPMTNTSPATYLASQQALYGVWDWNLSSWNLISPNQKYAALSTHSAVTGTSGLTQQSILNTVQTTVAGQVDLRTVSSLPVCYADVSGCTQFGWFLNLVSGNVSNDLAVPVNGNTQFATNPLVYEQVVFSPVIQAGAFIINTTIPPAAALTQCFNSSASGWTMALNPATGGAFTNAFFGTATGNFLTTTDSSGNTVGAAGAAFAGTGSFSTVQNGSQTVGIMQTVPGTGKVVPIFPQGLSKGKRLNWIEKR
jgi:type IV pilus assembly protein PilY1